ncbi:MAG: formate dehydrogenase accessory sulfurtransferase FdhD [Methanobrevibacter sp.]|nr:formate dehydrogenase accessory sulfurtransferase FdhD [Methanobrevibacter sp.]
MTNKVEAFIWRNGTYIKKEEEIVSDETITLVINDTLKRNFSISPESLKDFAIGYMLGENLINSVDNIENLEIEDNEIIATIDLEDFYIRKELIAGSDCFGGWRSKIDMINKVDSDLTLDGKDLLKNMEEMNENAFIWKKTGGTHIASLINKKNNEFISREDISRHVAVDKVIGAAARKKLNFKDSYIIYSGRMPADVLIKIARVGIPIIVSNAAPTLSGYSVANEAKITMIGFIRENKFNVYTHENRVK